MYRHDNEGIIVEIIIRESSGAKIETHKFMIKDKKKTKAVLYSLRKKYGLNDFGKGKDSDIDWLNQ